MGKYIKKNKTDGKLAVMEVTHSSLGVRTRAKTLALHNSAAPQCSGSYLQLRNRRLQKPPLVHDSSKRLKQGLASNQNITCQNPKLCSGSDGSVPLGCVDGEKAEVGDAAEDQIGNRNNNTDDRIEASFGDNALEVEGRERGSRESTPCNSIRDADITRTPCSTTRSSVLTGVSRRVQNANIPSARELDEFFTATEKEEQKSFLDKYNFDPATDKPLPGRFEWEKVDI